MIDVGILLLCIWLGCFILVSVDSAYRKISPVFWRLASLFGGLFALAAYAIVREQQKNKT